MTIIASVVSAVQTLINAYAFGLYQSLGIFYSVIVMTVSLWAAPQPSPPKRSGASALDGFSIGMGVTCAMFVLASVREIIGNGTLFDGAYALLGSWAKALCVEVSTRPPLPAGDAASRWIDWPGRCWQENT
ncbi:Rnf-Nqr domain containing protein [Escherichia coli]